MLKKFCKSIGASLTLLCSVSVQASDLGGLQIAGAADLVAGFGFQDAPKNQRLQARSVELSLFGPTDHLFEGMISFAAHVYQGEQSLDVHEAYIKTSKLIPRSKIRVGQFFLNVGRLNSIHQHDWPFIQVPLVQEVFFDSEGIIDSGLEWAWLAPTPFFLDVTMGLTSGWRITHSHGDEGEKPKVPTHYLKAEFFQDLPKNGGLLWGLNYLGRKDANERWMWLTGAHAVAKWRKAQFVRLQLQSEFWSRTLKPRARRSETELGGYFFGEFGFTHWLAASGRFDFLSNLSLKDFRGDETRNYRLSMSPELTARASEFSLFRLGYSYRHTHQQSEPSIREHLVSLQTVFILGAHPAHDF